eukprot:4691364-Pyramimonas_sp.AAC.1
MAIGAPTYGMHTRDLQSKRRFDCRRIATDKIITQRRTQNRRRLSRRTTSVGFASRANDMAPRPSQD